MNTLQTVINSRFSMLDCLKNIQSNQYLRTRHLRDGLCIIFYYCNISVGNQTFFIGSRLRLPLKKGPAPAPESLFFINFLARLRLPLKRQGSRLLRAVFRGFYRLRLSIKRPGSGDPFLKISPDL